MKKLILNKNIIVKLFLTLVIGIGILILPGQLAQVLGCHWTDGSLMGSIICGYSDPLWLTVLINLPGIIWWYMLILTVVIPGLGLIVVLLAWYIYLRVMYWIVGKVQLRYFSKYKVKKL